MCGIVTAMAFGTLNKKDEEIRQVLMRILTTELLLETEDRGKDATGASVLFDDGRFFGIKRGEASGNFLSVFGEGSDCFGGFLKIWREYKMRTRIYLGHCRQGTTGDKEDNANNHPIKINNLVGVHNGVIRNHEVIFKNLGCQRDGKVDSEAIFRLFDYFTHNGKEPFTIKMMQEVCNRLEGQYAIAMFNADNPFQVPMMRDGRPIEFVIIRPFQIVLALSDKKFWDKIHFQYERLVNYYSEALKIELPSLLDKGAVSTEVLEDDSAIIFDLSVEIKPKSDIKDLGKWAKMERMHKIWTEASSKGTTTTYYGATGGSTYRGGVSSKASSPRSASTVEENKKRRVWDNIKRKYVVKIGDKEVADNEEVTLDATTQYDDKAEEAKKEETKTEEKKVETKAEIVTEPVKEVDEKKTAELKDTSSYDTGDDNTVDATDVIEIDPRDIKEISSAKTIEIKTESIPPELFTAAIAAYDSLPMEKKGFSSLEEMVIQLDIKDVSTANTLAPLMLANRAHKAGFRKGYIVKSMESPLRKADDKDARRERHIALLKSLLVLMGRYFEETSLEAFLEKAVEEHLKDYNLTNTDLESLNFLLNNHEKETLSEVIGLIDMALKTKKKEEGNKNHEGSTNTAAV